MPSAAGEPAHNIPLAYLLTFTAHGTWLHGDSRGSVARDRNGPGDPTVEPNPSLVANDLRAMKTREVYLDTERRAAVQFAIEETSGQRDWSLHAVAVRTNHVHVVVAAPVPPERVLTAFKANATRVMRERALFGTSPGWTRHGSTRYLWTEQAVADACRYVEEGQGAPLP
jgi:REP element-mobilizing transposase RayT